MGMDVKAAASKQVSRLGMYLLLKGVYNTIGSIPIGATLSTGSLDDQQLRSASEADHCALYMYNTCTKR